MTESIKKRWATIYANDDFICFQTYSGLRRAGHDPNGRVLFAKPGDSAATIGQALIDAISASRTLRPDEIATFFDLNATKERYEQWVADLMQRFGYSSRRMLFKKMKNCSAEQLGDVITLRPLRHEKLEGWSGDGIDKNNYVQLKEDSGAVDIGQGVLVALSRCIA